MTQLNNKHNNLQVNIREHITSTDDPVSNQIYQMTIFPCGKPSVKRNRNWHNIHSTTATQIRQNN